MPFDPQLAALTLIAFSTSSIAGLFGFAGGMMFIAVLPNFLPASAIIPIHAAVQLFSNSSRAVFGWRSINWQFVKQHWIGSVFGIALAFTIFSQLNLEYLPLIIGIYILLHTWSKPFAQAISRFESFYLLGAIQTGVSLLIGAPGPIPLPLLLKKLKDQHQVVCTMAMFVVVGHLLKLGLFAAAGFEFAQYWREILAMIVAVILGSYVGTHFRHRIATTQYLWVAKALLTILALLAIIKVLTNQI